MENKAAYVPPHLSPHERRGEDVYENRITKEEKERRKEAHVLFQPNLMIHSTCDIEEEEKGFDLAGRGRDFGKGSLWNINDYFFFFALSKDIRLKFVFRFFPFHMVFTVSQLRDFRKSHYYYCFFRYRQKV